MCTNEVKMGQFGVYDMRLSADDDQTCHVKTALEPVNATIAILYCFLIVLALGVLYRVFRFLDKRGKFDGFKKAVKNKLRDLGFEVIF